MSKAHGTTSLNNQSRIKLFCEVFESDRMIIDELQYPDKVHAMGPDHPEEYARLLVVAMLLRKYFQTDENVKITSVINSMNRSLPCKKPPEIKKIITCLLQYAPRWKKPPKNGIVFQIEGQAPQFPADLLTDMLYGNAMHGDLAKAERIRNFPLTSRCVALNETNQIRFLGVKGVYEIIEQWRTKKILDF
ncbi:MAG: hypothetical protein ABF780_08245 [Bifidobacterium aquikefiri]|uniref:Uncharacterized protein n=1 Tax=Bifidobacterium aquikefiri TaxID=1653207 RepID=A0A261G763_9BIFI|nr:hypothetical protein [Bifidobacterium aquikefiri]OZG67270.1 hypothetical protein BAQU_1343 [Bifidobacterium aquikefiri]